MYREVLAYQHEYITLELNCSCVVTAVRPSDGKARIRLVTSTYTMSYNVLSDNKTRHNNANDL
jgi:hypothetical protein